MAEQVGVSDAIRAGLKKFGNEAGKEVTNKLKAWIVEQYPHLSDKVETTTFASTLSSLRKKAREGGEQPSLPLDDEKAFEQVDEAQKALTAEAPKPVVQAPAAPDMGVFVATVKELQRLAVKVGGKDNLRKLMDLL